MEKKKGKNSALASLMRSYSCALGSVLLISSLALLTLSVTCKKCKGLLVFVFIFAAANRLSDVVTSHQDIFGKHTVQDKLSDFFLPQRRIPLRPKLHRGRTSNEETIVECQQGYNQTFSRWLSQHHTNSSSLCDPTFHSSNKRKVDFNKQVKVFIMMGQSNMFGRGLISGKSKKTHRHSLEHAVKDKKRFNQLWNESGADWSIYQNIRNVGVSTKGVYRNEWLGENKKVGVRSNRVDFGPDLQFGSIMSQVLGDAPVLLLKSCIGNRSLGWDLLPPGSPQYEHDGYMHAGSGESPERWRAGMNPKKHSWFAGKQYDIDVTNAKTILRNLDKYVPGILNKNNYEIAGFVWWQGKRDLHFPGWVHRYEENLVNLINSLRRDFRSPKAKFAIATIGFGGFNMTPEGTTVFDAQMAVSGDSGKYPAFHDNVKTVDIRSSWREPEGIEEPAHYHRHAETYLETGNALGGAMTNLLLRNG